MHNGSPHILQRAVIVGAATLLLTCPLLLGLYGLSAGLGYLAGLLAALLAQHLFLRAMRRRIGPERSTLADVLTLTENEVRMPPCFNRGMKDFPPSFLLQKRHACGMLGLEKMFYISFEGDGHGQADPDNG